MGSRRMVVPLKQTLESSRVASIHEYPCSHVAELYNAFYPSSSRGNDSRRCGCVDVDGANPDFGVNKDFVVSKFPALTHVSDAEVHPLLGLFRATSSALHLQ
jgi:hypothetical protein